MKTLAVSLCVMFAGSAALADMDCAQAEDAFFAQYPNQKFAKDPEAFRVDQDRWGEVAKFYMAGSFTIMRAEANNEIPPPHKAKEFLVNSALIECWRDSVAKANVRTKELESYLEKQLPADRRRQLEAVARRAE